MKQTTIGVLIAVVMLVTACSAQPAPTVSPTQTAAGLANPASVFCVDQGGQVKIRDEAAGQVGYCLFPDGSECEEWAFYRGECAPASTGSTQLANPASQNCVAVGGTVSLQTRGDGGQYGICLFEDNRQCEEWALLRGQCPVGGIKVTGYSTPAAVYCAITGGQYAITGKSGADDEQGTCTFPDGSQCDVWEYYNGKCAPNPSPTATSGSTVQPLSMEVCDGQAQAMSHALGDLVPTQSEEPLSDPVRNASGTGCQAAITGTGVQFASPDAPVKALGTMLAEQGWTEDPMLAAGGPTGVGAGYRKGDQICLVGAIWQPDASANCPQDQPISACQVKPEQQNYTVTLNCGAETSGEETQPVAAAGQFVSASESDEIQWAGPTSLPDYIGAPAKAHPTANSGVPQNPLLWPNPFNSVHMDPWNSDVVDIAGPLGRDPVAFSSTLADARRNLGSIEFQCVFTTYTSHGRMITSCFGVDEASVVLLNPETLEVYDHYELPVVSPEEAPSLFDAQGLNGLSASYIFFDKNERLFMTIKDDEGKNKIVVLVEGRSDASPALELDQEYGEFDMSKWVPANNRLNGLALDWEGRIWFYLSGMAKTPTSPGIPGAVGVFYPALYPDDSAVQFYQFQDSDEQIRNTMAITKTGVYVVTSKKMYRFGLDAEGKPQIVWEAGYENVGHVKPGSYNAGSGTSPTILGEGRYVAITDNAEPYMQVVVYRTDAEDLPPEERVVCEVPVFTYAKGGALDNSLLGSRLSLIVENNYGYVLNLETMTLTGGEPGFERIDIDPNGRGCTKVWVNTEVASTASAKLSTRTGLIYTFSRKYDEQNQVWAYYWTALDFRTGEVVWEKLAGTGHEKFENFWPALYVGPNETLTVGLFGGLAALRDTP